ncbi:MAG: (Fe-S)-binding protein [Phycisphaerales bacterium]|nr:(Fe-S)-binding protein [Phycisphaerales bacterium]
MDQFFPQVGMNVAAVLARLGHVVRFPSGQTCCGQPAWSSGFRDQARAVGEHFLKVFRGSEAIVAPSGSCAAMVRAFYPELFDGTPRAGEAKSIASRTFEFSQFLVDQLHVTDVGASFHHRVTFHDGCHGLRELGIRDQPRALLKSVKGLELVEMDEAQTCCGFGGAFSINFGAASTAMAEVKVESARATRAEFVVAADPTCLMQIGGLSSRRMAGIRCLHLAEVLART